MSDILAVDLIRALWEDSRRESDPERKAQLERDAAVLEDVWQRSPYALAPTRDQMTAAIGNASLNIADTLSAMASGQRQVDTRVGEIHTAVQENNTLFSTFFETFPPQFAAFQNEMRAAAGENRTRLGKLEDLHLDVVARLDSKREMIANHELRITALEANNTRLEALEDAIAALRAASIVERDG